ncbi:P-loop NTPase fold protein [Amycolatopsis japonica]|uniref:P-loop NTPase fold protein n=1 Tax=Amycolatopsis japonica TaxID=208439 RepID=UPI0033CB4C94
MARKALIVGSSRFTDPSFEGLDVTTEAAAVAAVFGDEAIGGFEVASLSDQSNTTVFSVIARFFDAAGPEDVLLLYLIGGGVQGQGEWYFASTDTDARYAATSALSSRALRHYVETSDCRKFVLIFDFPFSGAFAESVMWVGEDFPGERAIVAVSATNALREHEKGPSWSAGVLADALVDGLRTGRADADRDGVVTAEEFGAFLGREAVTPVQQTMYHVTPAAEHLRVAVSPAVHGTTPGSDVEWAADATAREDFLHRDELAGVLALRLTDARMRRPDVSFLVHVDGAWGTGKTTLLGFLRRRLDGTFLLVEFDAWRQARLGRPWWTLLTAARDAIAADRGWWGRRWLRSAEVFARARRTGAPYAFAVLVLVLLVGGLAFWLWPRQGTAGGWSEAAKVVGTVVAAMIPFWAGALVVSRFLLWNSARGAKLFEESGTNPMAEVSAHFSWLLGRTRKPLLFLIDDLDRCGYEEVVGLLDTVQTVFRNAPGAASAPLFVVAADGAWLRKSYESKYPVFEHCVARPGKSLGYLFLEKLFQITVPMPSFTTALRRLYIDRLLRISEGGDSEIASEAALLRGRLRGEAGREREILDILDEASAAAKAELVGDATRALAQPVVREQTEHWLRKFAPLISDTPRGFNQFVNTYTAHRAIRTLEGNTVGTDTLALWCVVRVRWPDLFDHLEAEPSSVAGILDPALVSDHFPERLREVAASASVREVVASTLGGPLYQGRIEQCCGVVES